MVSLPPIIAQLGFLVVGKQGMSSYRFTDVGALLLFSSCKENTECAEICR